jgi:aryl-alcohol dehydrogenase-like predicted oxidoreductase
MSLSQYAFKKIRIAPSLPEIYPIGIGTWAWGDKFYWSVGSSKINFNDLERAFNYCVVSDVIFFDTAEVYAAGRSEKTIARFNQQSQAQISIGTKFLPYPWRRSSSFRKALKKSLKRLGEESIDLYQMHWPLPRVPIATWMNLMADAVEDGLIKAVGVSNFNLAQTQEAVEALARRGIKLASNQIIYHLIERRNETSGLIDFCKKNGITVIAYSPLAQGILTGKFTPQNPPPGVRGLGTRGKDLIKYHDLLEAMRAIAERHQRTQAQVAINWTICKGTVPIPGVKSLKQAKDNLGAIEWRLSEEEVRELDQISQDL